MYFEKNQDSQPVAYFEVDQVIKIHEQHVAANALGFLTLQRRENPEERAESALLGANIMVLDHTETVKDEATEKEETKPKISSMELPIDQAKLLAEALHIFSEDTPHAIQSILGTSHACNARAIEGHLADSMLKAITDEYKISVDLPKKHKVGF